MYKKVFLAGSTNLEVYLFVKSASKQRKSRPGYRNRIYTIPNTQHFCFIQYAAYSDTLVCQR